MKPTKISRIIVLLIYSIVICCCSIKASSKTYCLSEGKSYRSIGIHNNSYDVFFSGKVNPCKQGGYGILWVYGYAFSGDFSNYTENSIEINSARFTEAQLVKNENRWVGGYNYKIRGDNSGPILFDHATISWNNKKKVSIKTDNDYYYFDNFSPLNNPPEARVQLSDGGYIKATHTTIHKATYIIEYPNGDIFIGLPSNLINQSTPLQLGFRKFVEFMLALKKYKSTDFIPWDGSMSYASGKKRDNFEHGESMNEKERQRLEKEARAEKERIAQRAAEEKARIKLQEQERRNEELEKQAKHNRLVKKYGESITKEIESNQIRIGTSEAVLIEHWWTLISESSSTRIYYDDILRKRVVCRNGKVVQIDRY